MTAIELLLLGVVIGSLVVALYCRLSVDETLVASFPMALSGEQAAQVRDILRNRKTGDPIILSNGGTVYRLNGPYPNSDASG